MVNIRNFIKSLKLAWVRRLLFEDKSWKNIILQYIDLEKMFTCGPEYVRSCCKNIRNVFWVNVFNAWIEFAYMSESVDSLDKFGEQTLFYNKNIYVGNSHVYIESWYKRNIRYVNDLLDSEGNFLSLEEFNRLYNLNANFLTFQGIIAAINKTKQLNFQRNCSIPKTNSPFVRNAIYYVIHSKNGSKEFYRLLNSSKDITLSKGMSKWKDLFDLSDKECKNIILLAFKCTINTKLQWFQYRIVNKILCTNSFLYKIGKAESSLCTFCGRHEETIVHIFWECENIQTFLSLVEDYCFNNLHCGLHLGKKELILGDTRDKSCRNLICLQIKYYIYSMRCMKKDVNVLGCISYIRSLLEICKNIAYRKSKVDRYRQFWNNWLNIL